MSQGTTPTLSKIYRMLLTNKDLTLKMDCLVIPPTPPLLTGKNPRRKSERPQENDNG
jgi:hypothetical protein